MVTVFVLLLNVILAIIATTAWDPKDGIATAFTGDCTKAARWTTALHLLINLLGSLLLGASNYCMQRLVSPTRKEIDEAHAKKKWLDIGVPSIRNLSSVKKGRVGLWILLGLSSLPLHLVYNSVFFETIAANNVALLIVAPEFFTDKNSWSIRYSGGFDYLLLNVTSDNFITQLQETLLDGKYLDRTRFENVTGPDCVKRYTSPFITTGNGFGVPNAEFRNDFGLNASESLLFPWIGSGDFGSDAYSRELNYDSPITNARYISAIAVAAALAGVMKAGMRYGEPSGNEFGRVNVSYLIDINSPFGEQSIISYVLLANLPQAVASLIYITYNGLFTCMLANREWTGYTIKRAPLRVTIPRSGQRSTYFLQLPYAWSVPLLVASILLH
ncbi:hypothetical protein K469DRAFT_793638 [Zopfia rhizophila CBS 207.26]|uniref:DUF6536 domain-containing protein n=1 Tax=Zopfia rhizophila CBS 207.26 TaxID=1314779 RepID=A0A6A6DTM0_9PEZI|nr:hypothetical protein K469DRAFT_793638 [Zopfia rhizophila CBS 207.26]